MASITSEGVALLGAGIFATEEHLPSLKHFNASLKAVYSRSHSSAAKLLAAAEKLGYPAGSVELYSDDTAGKGLDELLKRSDIAGVVIALPIPVQPDICRKVLAAGKHVLMEKPIAKDVATARALIAEYQEKYEPKGLVLSIAEQFRYMAAHDLARKWLVEDKLAGKLQQVHFRLWRNQRPSGKYYDTPWRQVPDYQGGFVLDGGVHHIALLRYVTGEDIVETRGFASQFYEHLPPTDTVNAAVLFRGGAVGTLSMSFASHKIDQDVSFLGSEGSVVVESGKSKVTLKDKDDKVVKEEVAKSNGVDNEIEAFLKAMVAGKNEHKAGAIEALNDVAVIESLVTGGGKVKNWEP